MRPVDWRHSSPPDGPLESTLSRLCGTSDSEPASNRRDGRFGARRFGAVAYRLRTTEPVQQDPATALVLWSWEGYREAFQASFPHTFFPRAVPWAVIVLHLRRGTVWSLQWSVRKAKATFNISPPTAPEAWGSDDLTSAILRTGGRSHPSHLVGTDNEAKRQSVSSFGNLARL